MKPWFEKEKQEADIIKFPEPERKVIKMPSVSEYPDFITGVLDLQARRDQGQIGQDSYDKLYQDLIHRFMKKESFDTPWFLREAPVDDVIGDLEKIGFNDVKKHSGKTVYVYSPNPDRQRAMNKILSVFKGSTKELTGKSSIGYVKHPNGTNIVVKPAGKQGVDSAGLKNEQHLIQKINQFVKEVGPLDITFVGDNKKSITAKGVTEARGAGADTKGRKKSDVNLVSNGKVVPVSIKSRTADYWESADTLFGPLADKIITSLLKKDLVTLTPIEAFRKKDNKQKVRINPEVAMKLSKSQVLDVVFGSDILALGGGIVKESFEDEHYVLKANNLTVTADTVIKDVKDIPERMQPYLHIRNAHDRNRGLYPGTKVQAAYYRRVKNALIVDQQMNVVQLSKKQRAQDK
tara:strand:+ start:109 stop:1323 length:1215 start_codon:yes stop_codon:yes gene_type:complete